jgi:hypothetical protein
MPAQNYPGTFARLLAANAMCKLRCPKGTRNASERAARTYRRGDPCLRHELRSGRAAIARHFPAQLRDKVKTITLRGARIPPPPFYAQAKEMSGGNSPDFVHLASFTSIDLLVFHDEITPRALCRRYKRRILRQGVAKQKRATCGRSARSPLFVFLFFPAAKKGT